MKETLAIVLLAGIVSTPLLIGAGLVLAIIILVAALLLFRSSGKKKAGAPNAGAGGWQPQGQTGTPDAWNQQPGAGGWGQPAQAQQQGGWGQPGAPDQQAAWGQPGAPDQQAAWGQPAQAPQQGAWGSPSSPDQQGGWGQQPAAQAPQQAAWGQQPAQASWDAGATAGAQDPWAQQQQPSGGQQWGQAQPGQQAPTAYGANAPAASWSQPSMGGAPAQADPWAPAGQQQQGSWGNQGAQTGAPAAPSWQQQQGGFPQGSPGMPQQDAGAMFGANDGDRTMLRTTGPQGGVGLVRVEEGKEPGRIYEVRKESLSIGRSRESDIFLEDLAVSRLHASILNMGNGSYALKDEGSANGTKVNGQLVNKYQTYPLQEGDRIQLGQTVLVFGRH